MNIIWDLRESHTKSDVRWPRPGQRAVAITPIGSVRILLPSGREFVAQSGIDNINMSTILSENGDVSSIDISSRPQTTEGAYRLAKRWATDWHLPSAPIEEWYRNRKAGRARGHEDLSTRVDFSGDRLPGRDSPYPGISIAYSFQDDVPSIVEFTLAWDDESSSASASPIPTF